MLKIQLRISGMNDILKYIQIENLNFKLYFTVLLFAVVVFKCSHICIWLSINRTQMETFCY